MALTYQDDVLSTNQYAPQHPRPSSAYPLSVEYSVRLYSDDDRSETPVGLVVYLHGSGASGPLSGPLVEELVVNRGYILLAVMALGTGESDPNPFKYGYGNVNAPHFMSHFIKDGWWAEVAYSACEASAIPLDIPFVMLGHSRGGAALISLAAGYSQRSSFSPNFRGIITNGATVGGLGDFSWNDVNRNANTLSGMVHQLQVPSILLYSDNDPFCPPDYSKTLQVAIPEGAETYFISPGSVGHDWMNTPEHHMMAANWVTQMMEGGPILDRNGNPAVSGPVIPAT